MNYLERIKKDTKSINDLVFKEIKIKNNIITIISLETITSTSMINEFILKRITFLKDSNNLINHLLNDIPCNNIKKIKKYEDIINYLVNGFTIIFINEDIIALETISNLSRSISEASYEKSITGPKDSFIEQFNTNVGLIRKRIKIINLKLESFNIGKYTNTKIGIMYINKICKNNLKKRIIQKIKKINIDGIIDSAYLKKYLISSNTLFPLIKSTERPDLASQALLEGKIIIITDNSPNILILPSFFIDYFHTSDDYYQKSINISLFVL